MRARIIHPPLGHGSRLVLAAVVGVGAGLWLLVEPVVEFVWGEIRR